MEGLKKDIDALKANPIAEVKAEPFAEAKPNPATNDDLINMKKETEETKANLNKLKENVQTIVKKIKEEFTSNKTETGTIIEVMNQ